MKTIALTITIVDDTPFAVNDTDALCNLDALRRPVTSSRPRIDTTARGTDTLGARNGANCHGDPRQQCWQAVRPALAHRRASRSMADFGSLTIAEMAAAYYAPARARASRPRTLSPIA